MAIKYVTVSIEIMRDENLSSNQKFMLAEIEQLSSLDQGCFATNRHFSELLGITKQGVSKALKSLENKEYITIDYSKSFRNKGRILAINSGLPLSTQVDPVSTQVDSTINSGLQSKDNIQTNIQLTTTTEEKAVDSSGSSSFYEEHEREIETYLTELTDQEHIKNKSKYRSKIRKILKDDKHDDHNDLAIELRDWIAIKKADRLVVAYKRKVRLSVGERYVYLENIKASHIGYRAEYSNGSATNHKTYEDLHEHLHISIIREESA